MWAFRLSPSPFFYMRMCMHNYMKLQKTPIQHQRDVSDRKKKYSCVRLSALLKSVHYVKHIVLMFSCFHEKCGFVIGQNFSYLYEIKNHKPRLLVNDWLMYVTMRHLVVLLSLYTWNSSESLITGTHTFQYGIQNTVA